MTLMRALVLAVVVQALGGPVRADLYALIIGVDRYDTLNDLQGAVNDAMDIADAVSGLNPKDMRVLLNEDATREAIYANWESLAAQAGPRDTLLVAYAGHGGNEPAAQPGAEDNGRDENILLSGFADHGPAAGQRIRDDEIAALIAMKPEVNVIFVADSCHSGSVHRQSTGRARNSEIGQIRDDPLPRLSEMNLPDYSSGQSSVFFGAVPEGDQVKEINDGMQARGALSLAFAAGLRGAADFDQDGQISKGELEQHVLRMVHRRTDGGQFPVVEPAGMSDFPLFRLGGAEEPVAQPANPFETKFEDLAPVPLDIINTVEAPTLHNRFSGTVATRAPAERLTWDVETNELFSSRGDLLTQFRKGAPPEAVTGQVQAALDKMRVARHLRQAGLNRELSLTLPTGDKVYRDRETIEMLLDQRNHNFPVLFNLASDGTIQFLYPDETYDDPENVPAQQPISLAFEAAPPFGADHLIALDLAEPSAPVMRSLRHRHIDTTRVRALWDDLHFALKDRDPGFAIFPFFTTDRP
jgi:hypothetical protein